MKFIETVKKNKLRCGCLVFLFLLTFVVLSFALVVFLRGKRTPVDITPDIVSTPLTETVFENSYINKSESFSVSGGVLSKDSPLPDFITFKNDLLTVDAKKWDNGEYFIKFDVNSIPTVYSINVRNTIINFGGMKQELTDYLNKKGLLNNYGIYVRDLARDATISINGEADFPPASMAKLTMAILILRDIDAGKYTLDTTYPIQDSVKFSTEDDLGKLPDGTPVPIHTYLEKLIEDSNNTAWYHMDKFLGGSYETVNPRTVAELGVNIFLNPHIGTTEGFGKLLDDLYNARTVTTTSRDYLINLMRNALEWNREGIGLGLPKGIDFANKIGNLWTDQDVNFCDSAFVFGKNTDYILVIMDKDIDWESGKQNLKDLSSIVYSYLDK